MNCMERRQTRIARARARQPHPTRLQRRQTKSVRNLLDGSPLGRS
jgi:hypothetical protein